METNGKHIKVIISGGGTGGHVYPAIAIADAIKELQPNAEILFVGAKGKMEMEKVPLAGYKIIGLWISGLQRRLTLQNLLFPFKLLDSMLKARKIVREFKPNVAVGVGGYASGPTLKAATKQKVPAVLQEQNSYAGLTNKLLADNVQKVFVAYPNMDKYFPNEKISFLGNPVRKDLDNLEGVRGEAYKYFGFEKDKKTLLVTGGSLGALTLNNSLTEGVDRIIKEGYQVIWQTGKFYIEDIKEKFGNNKLEGLWFNAFIEKMNFAYAIADVVIARAGALSISEICIAGKPALLVPSPNVAEDHQTKNAIALVSEEAAVLIKDNNAKEQLVGAAINLLADEMKQQQLTEKIKKFAKPNAAMDIAKEVIELAKNNN